MPSPYMCYDTYRSASKCRALILCNTNDRKAKGPFTIGWEEELAEAHAFLSQFFKVEVRKFVRQSEIRFQFRGYYHS